MFILFYHERQGEILLCYHSEKINTIEHIFIVLFCSLLSKDCCTQSLLILVENCHDCTDK